VENDPTFILLAFLLGYGAYVDVVNNRTIPNRIVYLSMLASLLLYLIKLLLGKASLDGLVVGGATFALLWAAYRMGLMGEAEAYYAAMVALHYPYAELFHLPLPSPIALFLYASIGFGIYLLLRADWRGKKDWRYLLLIPLYAVFALNMSLLYPIPPEVHLFFLLAVAVGLVSPSLKESFKGWVAVEEAEGEVPVRGPPVLLRKHVEEMKRRGVKRVEVFQYPPFLPFLWAAFVLLFLKQAF